jgi:hypothetical protein
MSKWQYTNPPRLDQIDLSNPIDWSNPQARGLVHYWSPILGTSNKLPDIKSRNNMVMSGTASVGVGKNGWRSIRLPGASYASTAVTLVVNNPATISFWFCEETQGATRGIVSEGSTALTGSPNWLFQSNSGNS